MTLTSTAKEIPPPDGNHRGTDIAHVIEDVFSSCILFLMAFLPVVNVIYRELLGSGLSGSSVIVQHLTLWISLFGAALAARSNRLLSLTTAEFLPDRIRGPIRVGVAVLGVGITFLLCIASLQLLRIDLDFGDIAAWKLPIWVFTAAMPVAFGVITLRLIYTAADFAKGRLIAALGISAVAILALVPDTATSTIVFPLGTLIVIGMFLGLPIYAALGGAALLLFWTDGIPLSAVPGEAYRMSTSAMLPAIPLFTVAGYLLAEGGSSKRLLRLFKALVGWMPGGIAIVVTLVLALFTPLTGASGITILAMGSLMLPMLVRTGHTETHSIGLVTVSGSIGIFIPPSLPVILYAYYAELDLRELFLAGLVPGLLLIIAIAGWGAMQGKERHVDASPFSLRELGQAAMQAKWEILLPVFLVLAIFKGFMTLVEASAATVMYAIIIECFVFKELSWRKDIRRIVVESAAMIGGFMIILSVALGFTNYLILAQVPSHILGWVSSAIESPLIFLLMLNVFLIIVGALMDIYSAIIVIVPLLVPLAAAYGIHPVHLAVVFLANMQLGYLMPPMGENLFLSAFRFNQPLTSIYKSVLPFVIVILIVVLLITYLPSLSLWPIDLVENTSTR